MERLSDAFVRVVDAVRMDGLIGVLFLLRRRIVGLDCLCNQMRLELFSEDVVVVGESGDLSVQIFVLILEIRDLLLELSFGFVRHSGCSFLAISHDIYLGFSHWEKRSTEGGGGVLNLIYKGSYISIYILLYLFVPSSKNKSFHCKNK